MLVALLLMMAVGVQAQTRYIPHVTRPDGGFNTTLIMVNTGPEVAQLRLAGFDALGLTVASIDLHVAAQVTRYDSPSELFGADVAHIQITGSEDVGVTAVYQRNGEGAAPAHVNETIDQAGRWRIYAGSANVTWDGVAVVNVADDSNFLTIQAYDAEGMVLETTSFFVPMPPNGKELHVLSTLFAPTASPVAWYDVISGGPMVVTALRGDLEASTLLWENQALPLPDAEPK